MMRKLVACTAFAVMLASGCQSTPEKVASSPTAEPPAPEEPEAKLVPLEPSATYGGHIETGFNSQVIRDQQAYDALVAKLPKNKVKKGPTEPNDDPLLDQPAIDFDEHMLAVAVCPTFYCKIEFVEMRRSGDVSRIVVSLPGEGEKAAYAARPYGIGNYRALMLPRIDGEIRIVENAQ